MPAIAPAAPIRPADFDPHSSSRRESVLAAVLDPSRLPTPPAVALQVAQTASRPDCRPSEIVTLLGRDPALCAKILKAVNSAVYALARPVAAIDRAVTILGLNAIRSLALGLSLPAMKVGRGDASAKEYWVTSVGGAIIARELAVRKKYPSPEDDLVAGLLRDLGAILLQATYPTAWADLIERRPARDRALDPCSGEAEEFGIDHAEVSAELLKGWNLPAEIVEPIRHHHAPERLAGLPRAMLDRARLLHLSGLLAQLDVVVENPAALERVLTLARDEFGFTRDELITFLNGVVPRLEAFGQLLNQDIGMSPDYGAVLTAGSRELERMAAGQTLDGPRCHGRDWVAAAVPDWVAVGGADQRGGEPGRSAAGVPAHRPRQAVRRFCDASLIASARQHFLRPGVVLVDRVRADVVA